MLYGWVLGHGCNFNVESQPFKCSCLFFSDVPLFCRELVVMVFAQATIEPVWWTPEMQLFKSGSCNRDLVIIYLVFLVYSVKLVLTTKYATTLGPDLAIPSMTRMLV